MIVRAAKRKTDAPSVTKALKAKKNESGKGKNDSDMNMKLKTLQTKIEELQDENISHIERIHTFEETITRLNNKENSSNSDLKSVSVKTVLFEDAINVNILLMTSMIWVSICTSFMENIMGL